MFLKALDLYFVVVVFSMCDNAIVADCCGITADDFLKIQDFEHLFKILYFEEVVGCYPSAVGYCSRLL